MLHAHASRCAVLPGIAWRCASRAGPHPRGLSQLHRRQWRTRRQHAGDTRFISQGAIICCDLRDEIRDETRDDDAIRKMLG
ncbi:MAG: hypothetical protein AAGC92_07085 [Pseudomonadota bacterium]